VVSKFHDNYFELCVVCVQVFFHLEVNWVLDFGVASYPSVG